MYVMLKTNYYSLYQTGKTTKEVAPIKAPIKAKNFYFEESIPKIIIYL